MSQLRTELVEAQDLVRGRQVIFPEPAGGPHIVWEVRRWSDNVRLTFTDKRTADLTHGDRVRAIMLSELDRQVCKDSKHDWIPEIRERDSRGAGFTDVTVCLRCLTERFSDLDAGRRVTQRRYRYDRSYLEPGEGQQ